MGPGHGHAVRPARRGGTRVKILYYSNFDVLRPSTNRISDVRFCEGFVENGCEVELTVPYVYRRYNIARSLVNRYYGIEHPFKIVILPTPFWEGISKWLSVPTLAAMVTAAYLRSLLATRGRWDETVVLSRDVNVLAPLLWINKALLRGRGPRVVLWAHEVKPESAQYRWVYRSVDGVIGTNSAIVEDVHAKLGVPRSKTAITLNPISTRQLRERLEGGEGKEAIRCRLGLPLDRPLVVYTGKVGAGLREIELILAAAARHPGYTFLFTGGKPEAVHHYRSYCEARGLDNVVLTGFLDDYTEVLQYQVAADVLVSFYSTQDHLVDYNYPQKITEYMLSGNPLVTPDYRATRDVLNERNAIFVAPEDPDSLAEGIRRAVEDRAYARRVAERAFRDVQEYTFEKRTRLLMDFFETLGARRGYALPSALSEPVLPEEQCS